nr:class III lanthionine synthetase LanKC [Streptomyces canus]
MESQISPAFLAGDKHWFTAPEHLTGRDDVHSLSKGLLPNGWNRRHRGIWTHLLREDATTVEQGWKIHVSCTPKHYHFTLKSVWNICRTLNVNWKFVSHPKIHQVMNGKAAPREYSGKAVTIYPKNDDQLRDLLIQLEVALADVEGPYILSDIRWRGTPIFLRYGAFKEMWCTDTHGRRVLALKDDAGNLVPDIRAPIFTPPEWLDIPAWLKEGTGFERKESAAPLLHDYKVHHALHYSNSGGVYLAEDENGVNVVIKEARPHVAFDAHGRDAIARLHHEEKMLRELSDHAWAPNVREAFSEWEHHFLVLEYIDGHSLDEIIKRESPIVRPNATAEKCDAYFSVLQPVLCELERIIKELHAAGYSFGDLTPKNVMVDLGYKVKLIDFETVEPLTSFAARDMRTRGFVAHHYTTPREDDWYAFASCQLWAYAPYNHLTAFNHDVLIKAVDFISEWFDISPGQLELIRSRLKISPREKAQSAHVERYKGSPSLISGILHAATPRDLTRLYPGDPNSLDRSGGIGLAHGASGVILALAAVGTAPPDEHVEWLHNAVRRAPRETSLGLYSGLAGAGLALFRLADSLYETVIDRILDSPRYDEFDLYSGQIGLIHLLIEVGEVRKGLELAEKLKDELSDSRTNAPAGLMHGYSGAAVLFSRCHRLTKDDHWRDACIEMIDRALAKAEGNRHSLTSVAGQATFPSLEDGTSGLIIALLSGWKWMPDDRQSALLEKYVGDIGMPFVAEGGVFRGFAGIAYTLAQAGRFIPRLLTTDEAFLQTASHYAGSIGGSDGDFALVGRYSLRLSTDLATGSAGIIFTEQAVRDPKVFQLPGMELEVPIDEC